jgi:hypothetical protein
MSDNRSLQKGIRIQTVSDMDQVTTSLSRSTRLKSSGKEITGFFKSGLKEQPVPSNSPTNSDTNCIASGTSDSESMRTDLLNPNKNKNFRQLIERSQRNDRISRPPSLMSVTSFRKQNWDSMIKGIQKSHGAGTSSAVVRRGVKTTPTNDKSSPNSG